MFFSMGTAMGSCRASLDSPLYLRYAENLNISENDLSPEEGLCQR